MDIKTVIKNTTPEQRQKAFQCKSAEELGQFAKEENIGLSAEDAADLFAVMHKTTGEISDDDLDNVAGGKGEQRKCPYCGSKDYRALSSRTECDCICNKCGTMWTGPSGDVKIKRSKTGWI